MVTRYVYRIASENPYNPLKEAIESIEWDNEDRLEAFYNTVIVDSKYEKVKRIYLRKWILQFLYMTCLNDEPKHLVARQVLVFSGRQNIGKTTWLKDLLPDFLSQYRLAGQKVDLSNEMSKKNCVEHALFELGELGSTFRKSDQDEFKSFVSADTDRLNIKYLQNHQEFRRRTSFFGTVNDTNFLQDKTGNSRFLVLPVVAINRNKVDMLQLYAQLLHEEKRGDKYKLREERYELTREEVQLQEEINESFSSICPVEEELLVYFDFSEPVDTTKKYNTATEIFNTMRSLGDTRRVTKSELNIASQYLDKKGLKNGRTYNLPPRRNIFRNDVNDA